MLRSMHELENYAIGATDGEIGHVTDLFFDDDMWTIRYLVVETGSWLLTRKVLISPFSLMEADWQHKRLPVRITRDQVRDSPDIDTQKPVSRQQEVFYADYYDYPYYWGGTGLWGDGMYIPMAVPNASRVASTANGLDDPHLRSCQSVMGHHVHASDGDIGHVQGMLVDEESWAIRFLVVDTSNWWLGHQVLIAPSWISELSWSKSQVSVTMTREQVQSSPRFDSTEQLNRQQEMDLYRHYDRQSYWERENMASIEKRYLQTKTG